jgi:hypothetical protein
MGSATVQGHLQGTGPHDWAEVAPATLVRLSCGDLIGADVVRADGHVMPASGFGRRDLLRRLRGGGGDFGMVPRFEFTFYRVLAILGGVCNQNVRPAR